MYMYYILILITISLNTIIFIVPSYKVNAESDINIDAIDPNSQTLLKITNHFSYQITEFFLVKASKISDHENPYKEINQSGNKLGKTPLRMNRSRLIRANINVNDCKNKSYYYWAILIESKTENNYYAYWQDDIFTPCLNDKPAKELIITDTNCDRNNKGCKDININMK